MRNIYFKQSIDRAALDRAALDRAPLDAAGLERELLEEMSALPARDRGGLFKMWHRHSLSLVHLSVLTVLEAEGALSMKRLAEAMDVSDAAVTGMVDRMEKRGLVERHHDSVDRRVILVQPTDAAKDVWRDAAEQRRTFLAKAFARLSDDEKAALLIGMRALRAARETLIAEMAAATATASASSAPEPDAAKAESHQSDSPTRSSESTPR